MGGKAPSMHFDRRDGIRKVLRFWRLYGMRRVLFKIAARSRRFQIVWRAPRRADIAMVGCGQYAFATIGYFISRRFGARFRWCYDPDEDAALGFAVGFRVPHRAEAPEEWLHDPDVRYVYIASNHASHTDYACAALASGRSVYLEKPVSVSFEQLVRLEAERQQSETVDKRLLFAGYNRPFSKAVATLRTMSKPLPEEPLSLCCFVSGHVIASDHWYRRPEEGTRICGNAGHWIDLFVHLSAQRGHPGTSDDGMGDTYRISLVSGDPTNPDDNFSLSMASDRGDVFTLMLTARTEPFEGVNETINFQQGKTIAKIDDFCEMKVWQGTKYRKYNFRPKDVGHAGAILQPFYPTSRPWQEIVDSTLLMLVAAEMARTGETMRSVSLLAERARLAEAIRVCVASDGGPQ